MAGGPNATNEEYAAMLNMFKSLSDSTRLRILWIIFDGEYCVNDIAEQMGMTKSAVSHQLKYLKMANIVKSGKKGKNVFYQLKDHCIKDIMNITYDHVAEKEANK